MTSDPDHPEPRIPTFFYTMLLLALLPVLFAPIYLMWAPYQPFVDGLWSAISYSYSMAAPIPQPQLPDSVGARLLIIVEMLLMGILLTVNLYLLTREKEQDNSPEDTNDTASGINMDVLKRDD